MNDIKLPDLTKQPLLNVDLTPNNDLPLRILKAYRENCDVRWVTNTNGECDNPLFDIMNKDCERRAIILDRAIKYLTELGN